jgi:hypothetical protein
MQLPNRARAYIPPSKLTEYLLSETHAVGRSKAKFFRQCGYDETRVTALERDLLSVARTGTLVMVDRSPYGTKYVVDGIVEAPNGAMIEVRTVWIIDADNTRPRFVTAYPAGST